MHGETGQLMKENRKPSWTNILNFNCTENCPGLSIQRERERDIQPARLDQY